MAAAPIPWHSTRLALDALARLDPQAPFAPEILPPYTAAVPDLLRLAGISALTVPRAPSCRWIGQGGGEVALNAPGPDARVHRGHLDMSGMGSDEETPTDAHENDRQVRWLDASGLVEGSSSPADAYVWNPLPWRRRALVPLVAADGRHEPGSRASVELAAGAVAAIGTLANLVPGARWEISVNALDQGRVRAEFDGVGRVARLCWANVFAQPAGPWPSAVAGSMDRHDLPADDGAGDITDRSPDHIPPTWSATRMVSRRIADGILDLTYRLAVHDDALFVTAHWRGPQPITLRHPTQHRGAPMECGDERSQWTLPQAASAVRAPVRVRGLRHASLAAGDGRGLCLAFAQPTTVVAWDGDLRLELVRGQTVRYAMIAAQRPADALTRLQSALGFDHRHVICQGLAATSSTAVRPVLPPGVEALAWRDSVWWNDGEGFIGEILLVEQRLANARAYLFTPAGRRPGRAARVDARGNVLADIEPTREGDGWTVDLDPGEIAIVRWRWA